MIDSKTCSRCETRFATDLVERDGRRFCELCLDRYLDRAWPDKGFENATAEIDGQGEKLPFVPRVSPRFRLNQFIAWAEQNPARLHQVAAAVLLDQGFSPAQLEILRTFPGIELTPPDDFLAEFGPIDATAGPGCRPNPVLDLIVEQWVKHETPIRYLFPIDGSPDDYRRQKLRNLAAMVLFENGFRTAEIACALGWANKGTASRAIEQAKEQIKASLELN